MRSNTRRTGLVVAVAGLLGVGAGGGAAAAPRSDGPAATSATRKCNARYVKPKAIKVVPTPDEPELDYKLQGVVYVSNRRRTARCEIKVCVGQELREGEWSGEQCIRSIIARGEPYYYSLAPSIDCDKYLGTGYFRSYARFEGSGVASMGAQRKVC